MLRVLVVLGSLNPRSTTEGMLRVAAEKLRALGAEVDFLDLRRTPLPLYEPGRESRAPEVEAIARRVQAAGAYLLGTPDYHGGPSGALKNFLDHFWREFTGKLFGYVCASHEKGLTAMDALRTTIRQCYGRSLPDGVSGVEDEIGPAGEILTERLERRLTMLAHDLVGYGTLLARKRAEDLAASEPTFLAVLREDS